MSETEKPRRKVRDLDDALREGMDLRAAIAAAPLYVLPDEEEDDPGPWDAPPPGDDDAPTPAPTDRVGVAREAIREALLMLGAAGVTTEERGRVAARLGERLPELAALAHAHPSEWGSAVIALGACGGFGSHLARIQRAVRQSADQLAIVDHAAGKKRAAVDGEEPDPAVLARLARSERGVKDSYANVYRVFSEDPRWSDLRLNEYGGDVERAGETFPESVGVGQAATWLQDVYNISASPISIKGAIHAAASSRAHNPVREYLERVRGRSTTAIHRVLPDVLGIENPDPLHRAMVGRWLISAVARAMQPGSKVDSMLVLVGKQGRRKSSFFATLGGEFFGDSPLQIGNKDAPITFGRFWLYELAELEGMTGAREVTEVRQFLTVRADTYRPPYASAAARFPRRGVFCGSVNESQYLHDPHGSRRFYTVQLPDDWTIPIPLLASMRDDIWAHALAEYESGERWWFEADEDVVREDDAQQYVVEDPWQGAVEEWLRTAVGLAGPLTTTRALELGIKMDLDKIDRRAQHRMVAILRRLGYSQKASPAGFRGIKVWVRG
jgi:hypothetical protein